MMNNPNCDLISRSALLELILERNRETCNDKLSCLQVERMVESLPAIAQAGGEDAPDEDVNDVLEMPDAFQERKM